MRLTVIKPIFVAFLVGMFLASSVVCCCIRHLAQEKAQSSCCHKSAKADPVKCADGCSSLIKSAENTRVFDLTPPVIIAAPVIQPAIVVFRPAHTIKPVFYHGPPGPPAVPLYILTHNLRI